MYCERYRCEMSADACLARQKKAADVLAARGKFAIIHGSVDPGCIHCAQGKEVENMGGDTERKCRACGETKRIEQFRLNKECSGGREWICPACRKIKEDERKAAAAPEQKPAEAPAAKAPEPVAMTPEPVEAPAARTCKKCGETKPLDEFRQNHTCAHGREPVCKDCRNEAYRQKTAEARASRLAANPPKPVNPEDYTKTKECRVCKQTKALALFVSNKNSVSGRENICKACQKIRNAERTLAAAAPPPIPADPAPAAAGIHIVNATDPDAIKTFLGTGAGQQIVLDAVRSSVDRPQQTTKGTYRHYPTPPPQVSGLSPQPSDPSALSSALSPLETQIGGDHYKNFAIQPIEFSTRNRLGFIEGCVVKRICRYNKPGGKGLQDLLKIKHEIDCLIAIDAAEKAERSEEARS